MDIDMELGLIESVLFLESEPLDLSSLVRITASLKLLFKRRLGLYKTTISLTRTVSSLSK